MASWALPTVKDNLIIDSLFTLARDQEKNFKVRIVSAVAYRGKIISYGFNQKKSHPFQNKFKKNPHALFLHAETDAIKNALKCTSIDILKKSTLYVVRAKIIDEEMVYGEAKPCSGCEACIKWFGLKKVLYTTDQNTIAEFKVSA